MQYRPDKQTLLAAVADFLEGEVRPALTDPALGFRALIAANLCRIIAGELTVETDHDARELAGLRAIAERLARAESGEAPADAADAASGDQPDLAGAPAEQVRAAIASGNAALAEHLRHGRIDAAELPTIREHLWRTLVDRLSVSNPRFDTKREIE